MTSNSILYIPIATTFFSAFFVYTLFRHWRSKPESIYLLWWMIGVIVYGLGTVTEALTTLTGWHVILFKLWYIVGAILGGAALAQGTVYLMLSRRLANTFTILVVAYATVASILVILSPVLYDKVNPHNLDGNVMAWQWVRLLTPLLNIYALVFLVGGALLSAWRYYKRYGSSSRVKANILIATGALLPGIGGSFAAIGVVKALYITEFVGIILIWFGYRSIVNDSSKSIHKAQRTSKAEVTD
jgi:hypothetical protein